MRQHGKKLILSTAGLFQLFFRKLTRSDITREPDPFMDLAVGVEDRYCPGIGPPVASVSAEDPIFQFESRFSAGRFVKNSAHQWLIFRRKQVRFA